MSKRSNGEGSFSILENGKMEMRKMCGYKLNGKPRILKVRGTSKKACIEKMKIKEQSLNREYHSNFNITKWTLTDLCNEHLQKDSNKNGKLNESSRDRRDVTIRNQIEKYPIGLIKAALVKPRDIVNHIELLLNENYSVSTVEKTLNVINAAYKWANKNEYFFGNPCNSEYEDLMDRLKKLDKRNSSDGVVIVLSQEQSDYLEKQIYQLIDNYTYQYIFGLSMALLLHTGMRVGELCALRWKDWLADSQTLSISKTRLWVLDKDGGPTNYKVIENEVKNYQARTIILNSKAVSVLEEIQNVTSDCGPEDYIFTGRTKKASNPKNYDAKINDYYRLMGLPSGISGSHVLRRTCATNMYLSGCNVEDIAAYLGDTPETIKKHYISLTKKIVAGSKVLNAVPYPTKK